MQTPEPSPAPNSPNEIPNITGVSISGDAQVTARDIIGGDQYIGYTASQVTVLLEKIRTEYRVKAFDGHSPYIGLAAFQERDANRFFGRETLTAELVTRVIAAATGEARAVFVAGPSGSGKSSLVRAGLVPDLRRGVQFNAPPTPAHIPLGSEHWLYGTLKPERTPLENLARVIADFRNSPQAGQDLFKHAFTDPTRLHHWVDIGLEDDPLRRAVIIIDQFEEIFTQLSFERENERVAFLNLLTYAATAPNGRTLVLFTLRSDFVTNCASYPNLNALVNQQFIQVGAMTPEELVSAVSRPAYQVGLRVDPALLAQIVNDVRGEPGALPLMQFALQDLFKAEKSKGELTLDGYLARGGLHQALERHADAEFAKLDDTEKQLARTVFSGLIEIGRGHEDTKRTTLFSELVPKDVPASNVQALVRALADARLITTDEQDGKEIVTLAHERLIDAWGWLRKLVDENREAIALQNEITQDAREWEQSDREESYLYRGARLATAREKLDQNKLALSGLAQEFVESAVSARERERAEKETARQHELEQAQALAAEQKQRADEQIAANKRLRQRNLFLAAAFVLALVAIGAALFFLRESNTNLAKASTAEKIAVANENTANQAKETAQAERQAAQTAQAAAQAAANAADTAAHEAGRQQLLAERARETAVAGEQVANSRALAAIALTQIDENPARAILIALEANKNAVTFESEDALRRALPSIPLWWQRAHEMGINAAQFSPDGTKIITVSDDNTARVWETATHQQMYTLTGHAGPVQSGSFSPDSTGIVTASDDGTARLWEAETGKLRSTLRGHSAGVVHSEYSADGTKIVTASKDGTARLWEAETGRELDSLELNRGPLKGAHFSPDGAKIVTFNDGLTVALWDTSAGGDNPKVINSPSAVNSVAFSPDGRSIVTAHDDSTARVWDVETGTELLALEGHGSSVHVAKFSPDGKYIITGSGVTVVLDRDNSARVWDAKTGKQLAILNGHLWEITSAEFSPDGSMVLTAGVDGTARLWKADSGKQLAKFEGHSGTITGAHFSPDGTSIMTAGWDGSLRVWDGGNGRELQVLRGHTNYLSSAQFSPDNTKILTASADGSARVWDVQTGKELVRLEGNGYSITGAWFSPDGTIILTTDSAGATRFWDPTTGNEIALLIGEMLERSPDGKKIAVADGSDIQVWDMVDVQHLAGLSQVPSEIIGLDFSPDGTSIVIWGEDQNVGVWDAQVGVQVAGFNGHVSNISSARFSPDNTRVVSTGADGTALIWDAATGQELYSIHNPQDEFLDARFSRDGKNLVTTGTRDYMRIWDIESGSQIAQLNGSFGVFSPDSGKVIVQEFNNARVWDTTTGKPTVTLRGAGNAILKVQFAPDGKTIVTGNDSNARIWDLETGQELSVLRGHDSVIGDASFSPDGTMVVTAGFDGTARVYFVHPDDLMALAQERVGRDLTCQEQATFLHLDRDCAEPTP